MPDSWTTALKLYCYPVDLGAYHRSNEFDGFFEIIITGDRNSTIAFENHFRESAPNNVAAFYEVVFWKLFSQPGRRDGKTDSVVNYVHNHNILPKNLWDAVIKFIKNQNIDNLRSIRTMLGFTSPVLATTLTFPALACPEKFPMIDNQVAKWVNLHGAEHSVNTNNNLTSFILNQTSLRENDFFNYLNWIAWCREISIILTNVTNNNWRARDVEMAVFTAQRNNLLLNPLTNIAKN